MGSTYEEQSGEILRKAGEYVNPGDKSDTYIKTALSGPGGVPSPVPIQGAENPSIQNISAAVSGTEYVITIAAGTKRLNLRSRLFASLKLSFTLGGTSTNYVTVPIGSVYYESGLLLPNSLPLYVTSTKASDTIECISWS